MDGLKTIRHFVALIGFADSKRKNPPVLTDRLGAFALMGVVEQYEGSLAKLSLEAAWFDCNTMHSWAATAREKQNEFSCVDVLPTCSRQKKSCACGQTRVFSH